VSTFPRVITKHLVQTSQ